MRFNKVFLLVCMLIYFLFPTSLFASPDLNLKVQSAILMNADTGKILYIQNADCQIQPASLTKILSLYLIHESIREGKVHPQDKIQISKKARKARGSRMFVECGTEVQLEDLIKGMTVVSANDASIAAAEYLSGSETEFVEKMNLKARELGMTHSRFRNPNGLPAKGQTTTARDILMLSYNYIKKFPDILPIHAMKFYTYNNINQHNRNKLLQIYPEVDGLKTGYIFKAGYHIVVTAKRGNTRLIAVVMGAKTPDIRTRETKKLLEAGFKIIGGRTKDIVTNNKNVLHDPKTIRN